MFQVNTNQIDQLLQFYQKKKSQFAGDFFLRLQQIHENNIPQEALQSQHIDVINRSLKPQRLQGLNRSGYIDTNMISEMIGNYTKNLVPKQEVDDNKVAIDGIEDDNTIKYGDVVLIKYITSENRKSFIIGDGIASNQLSCIAKDNQKNNLSKDLAKAKVYKDFLPRQIRPQFRHALFQIMSKRQYFYSNQLKEGKDYPQFHTILQKQSAEEINDNQSLFEKLKGTKLKYDQEFQLRHIFSDCSIRINKEELAVQQSCREVGLEEQGNDYSNFTIIPANERRKRGEPISYSDFFFINSSGDNNYFLNVYDDVNCNLDQGLELNATESKCELKFQFFQRFEQLEEDNLRQSGKLFSGDLVCIKNKERGYLSLKLDRSLQDFIQKRDIQFYYEDSKQLQEEDEQNLEKKPRKAQIDINTQQYIMFDKLSYNASLKESHRVYFDQPSNLKVNQLWEIQKKQCYKSNSPEYNDTLLIRHALTGLYLQIKDNQIEIDVNGFGEEDCQFTVLSKKQGYSTSRCILLNEEVKIVQNTNKKLALTLVNKANNIEDAVGVQNISNQENDTSFNLFEIQPNEPQLIERTSRMHSILEHLYHYYSFLQNWGQEGIRDNLRYTYFQARLGERTLVSSIKQLLETLENLFSLITDPNVTDKILNERKSDLKEFGVLEILVYILRLTHFCLYGQITKRGSNGENLNKILINDDKISNPNTDEIEVEDQLFASFNSKDLERKIPKNTAMNVAKKYLRKSVKELFQVLNESIQYHGENSKYILAQQNSNFTLKFFLNEMIYYPDIVSDFLIKVTIYNDSIEEQDILLWTDYIKPITSKNIITQSFFIKLLGYSVYDSMEAPNPILQSICSQWISLNGGKGQEDPANAGLKGQDDPAVQPRILPRFEVIADRPVIIFENKQGFNKNNDQFVKTYEQITQFLESNKYPQGTNNEICFEILLIRQDYESYTIQSKNQLYRDQSTSVFDVYQKYIIDVMNLYSFITVGRNQIKSAPLSEQFVKLCYQYINYNSDLKLYKCIFDLYNSMILDTEPLTQISRYENRCFLSQDIREFQIDQESYKLFRDLVVADDKVEKFIERYQEQLIEKGTITQQQIERNEFKLAKDQEVPLDELVEHLQIQRRIIKDSGDFLVNDEVLQKQGMIHQVLKWFEFKSDSQIEEYLAKNPDKDYYPYQAEIKKLNTDNLQKKEPKDLYFRFKQDSLINSASDMSLRIFMFPSVAFYQQRNDVSVSNDQLEFFLTCLKIIRSSVDLGYNTNQMNMNIFKLIPIVVIYILNSGIFNQVDQVQDNQIDQNYKKEDKEDEKDPTPRKSQLQKVDIYKSEVVGNISEVVNKDKTDDQEIKNFSDFDFNEEQIRNTFYDKHKQHWVIKFLENCVPKCYSIDICYRIINECLKILQTLILLNINLTIFEIHQRKDEIKTQQEEEIKESEMKSKKEAQQQMQVLNLMKYYQEIENKKKQKMSIKQARKRKDLADKEKKIFFNQMTLFLFYTLMKVPKQGLGSVKDNMFQVLVTSFNRLQDIKVGSEEVEVLDDEYEEILYLRVNGTSQNSQILRPQEIENLVRKLIRYLKNDQALKLFTTKSFADTRSNSSPEKNPLPDVSEPKAKHIQVFESLMQELTKVINIFKLEDYDSNKARIDNLIELEKTNQNSKEQTIPLKDKHLYISQLQNIIRNAKIHKYLISFISDIEVHPSRVELYPLYQAIIEFFENFTNKNVMNQNVLQFQLDQLFQLVKLTDNTDPKAKPLQVHQLIVQIFSKEITQPNILDHINQIIENINNIDPFKGNVNSNDIKKQSINKMISITQYLRILEKFCIIKGQTPIRANQQFILKNIHQNRILIDIVSPLQLQTLDFHQNLWRTQTGLYQQLQMHVAGIRLVLACIKGFPSGIQEAQRFYPLNTLLDIVKSQFTPFIVQGAYMDLLFESRINTHTIVINSQEIPQELEQANLIEHTNPQKIIKSAHVFIRSILSINLLKETKQYGIGGEFSKEFNGIIRDSQEYFNLIFKDGLLNFLIDLMDVYNNEDFPKETKSARDQLFNNIIKWLENFDQQIKTQKLKLRYDRNDLIRGCLKIYGMDYNRLVPSLIHFLILRYRLEKSVLLKKITQTSQKKKSIQSGVIIVINQFKEYMRPDKIKSQVAAMLPQDSQTAGIQSSKAFLMKLCDFISALNTEIDNILKKDQDNQIVLDPQNGLLSPKQQNLDTLLSNVGNFFDQQTTQMMQEIQQQRNNQKNKQFQASHLSELKLAMSEILKISEVQFEDSNRDLERELRDRQIQSLLTSLFDDYSVIVKSSVPKFIRVVMSIYEYKNIELIIFLRVFLKFQRKRVENNYRQELIQSVEMTKDMVDMDQNDIDLSQEYRKDINYYQREIGETEIYIPALGMVCQQESPEQQFQCTEFINEILRDGFQYNQSKIISEMKKNIILQREVLAYILFFFHSLVKQGYDEIIALQKRKVSNITTNKTYISFAEKTIAFFKFIESLFDNTNPEAADYWRENMEQGANINIVMEISNFIILIISDEVLTLTDKHEVLIVALKTLMNICTGDIVSQQIAGDNQKMLNFIAHNVINQQIFLLYEFQVVQQNKIGEDYSDITKHNPNIHQYLDEVYSRPEFNVQDFSVYEFQKNVTKYSKELIKRFQIFQACIRFIHSTVAGNNDVNSLKKIYDQLDILDLLTITRTCYLLYIRGNERSIVNLPHNNLYSRIIEICFQIHLIITYFKDHFSDQISEIQAIFDEKAGIVFQKPDSNQKKEVATIQRKKQYFQSKNQYQIFFRKVADQLSIKGVIVGIQNTLSKINFRRRRKRSHKHIDDYLKFFDSYLGFTEILVQKQLYKVYFRKPYCAKFLSQEIQRDIVNKIFENLQELFFLFQKIYSCNRETDQDRVVILVEKYQYYYDQMKFKQKWYQIPVIYDLIMSWETINTMKFYFVCALNITNVIAKSEEQRLDNCKFAPKSEECDKGNQVVQAFYKLKFVVSYILLIMCTLILILCAIQRFPIYIYKGGNAKSYAVSSYTKQNAFRERAGLLGERFDFVINKIIGWVQSYFTPEKVKKSFWKWFFTLFLDNQILFFIGYLGLVILSLEFSREDSNYQNQAILIQCILLFQILKRSEDLINIIRSITLNIGNLGKFSLLGIIILYFYAIIAYNNFKGDFKGDDGVLSGSFLLTITSTIKEGLRLGEGISGGMENKNQAFYDQSFSNKGYYWSRYSYDLTFFIVINILFINIIFGIILDTFSQLRDNYKELRGQVEETCFICGISNNEFDLQSDKGWFHHIYLEHNVYHMLFFMINARLKPEDECDFIEKYVKGQLEDRLIDFIPIKVAISLEEVEQT